MVNIHLERLPRLISDVCIGHCSHCHPSEDISPMLPSLFSPSLLWASFSVFSIYSVISAIYRINKCYYWATATDVSKYKGFLPLFLSCVLYSHTIHQLFLPSWIKILQEVELSYPNLSWQDFTVMKLNTTIWLALIGWPNVTLSLIVYSLWRSGM